MNPTRYYVESFVTGSRWDRPEPFWLSDYLMKLMEAHEFTVLSPVEWEWPEPELIPYPHGLVLVRASVLVHEWDAEV